MTPFTVETARACPLGLANVDTDQLMPARFMKEPRKPQGYGRFLLHDLAHESDGAAKPDFPLNRPGAPFGVIVARRNFGSGSSREAAVYALVDAGIRCVVAPSFGDIFAGNAVNNGLLAAQVSEEDAERLLAATASGDSEATVDLERQVIEAGEVSAPFKVDPVHRTRLLNGWDDLDMTLAHQDEIALFRVKYALERPWAIPVEG